MEVKYWYTTLLVQANAQCSLQDNYTLLHGSEIWTDHVGKCPSLQKYTASHEEDIFVIRQLTTTHSFDFAHSRDLAGTLVQSTFTDYTNISLNIISFRKTSKSSLLVKLQEYRLSRGGYFSLFFRAVCLSIEHLGHSG